jgi:hypothetical protein
MVATRQAAETNDRGIEDLTDGVCRVRRETLRADP